MNPSSQGQRSEPTLLGKLFPFVEWIQCYTGRDFQSDLFAGVITAVLLVPQGIAYAMLAGLPPQVRSLRKYSAARDLCNHGHQPYAIGRAGFDCRHHDSERTLRPGNQHPR